MAEVAVARLRLAARPDRAGLASQRLTDALRLAPSGPERLLVVRRLSIGRMAPSARPAAWESRTAAVLAAHGRAARHGLEAGPYDEAVWFRSAAEARALLLHELAAGRRPTAWFWRLAVADWEGLSLPDWLPRWVALAEHDPVEALALARAIVAVAEAGRLRAVFQALAAPSSLAGSVAVALGAPTSPSPLEASPAREISAVPPSPVSARLARLTLARLPAAARAALTEVLVETQAEAEPAAWIARMAVIAATPEAAAAPALLAEAARAIVQVARRETSPTAPVESRSPGVLKTQDVDEPRSPSPPDEPVSTEPLPRAKDALSTASRPTSPSPARPAEASAVLHVPEQPSRIAGLFLTIGPLARMGLAEWLAARPALVAGGFGRGLLRTIGRRMRASADDEALAMLAGDDDADWADDLTAWRVGLDRWLRRTCRVRLAEVVRKRGALLFAAEILDVRFPPSAADVRLRRRALDLDPQWVPWLGTVVRYHYRNEPLQ